MIYLHLWVIARPGAFKLCVLKTVFRMLSLQESFLVKLSCDSITKYAIWLILQCRTSSVIKQIRQMDIVFLSDAFQSHQLLTANILCIILVQNCYFVKIHAILKSNNGCTILHIPSKKNNCKFLSLNMIIKSLLDVDSSVKLVLDLNK